MNLDIEKYVRKPVVVEAVQVTEDNFFSVAMWCNGEPIIDNFPQGVSERHIRVRVHSPQSERQKRAHIGDWVLYSKHGYKIYTNKAFEKSFDLEPSAELKKAWEEFKGVFKTAVTGELSQVTKPEKKHFRHSAICNVCGAPKGTHALGEMCNNNCGGRVIPTPASQQ